MNSRVELLEILWDKWKHHDGLAYKAHAQVWLCIAAYVALLGVVLGQADSIGESQLLVISLGGLIVAGYLLSLSRIVRVHRMVRDAYNAEISRLLHQELAAHDNAADCRAAELLKAEVQRRWHSLGVRRDRDRNAIGHIENLAKWLAGAVPCIAILSTVGLSLIGKDSEPISMPWIALLAAVCAIFGSLGFRQLWHAS